ncbi:MAG: PIN domain-containing protein [candidate division KSB1 bacterium]|nr:PIN domain-containing protein [candidate division KSB1 bacterium]MDZ7302078.1 PIN domain-containing protein [candidate division KSB1 bacterium]MDZ7311120.1 PIN domain-containing protein [candidate division KSB1 bacterium]
MATKHIIDTHALVWYLEGNPRLGANAKAVMDEPTSVLVIPLIALAEACWMVEYGKSSIPTVKELLAVVDADPRVAVLPLDRTVLDKTLGMTAITEMHDRQIVATALCLADEGETVAVLSKDRDIRASGLAPIIW